MREIVYDIVHKPHVVIGVSASELNYIGCKNGVIWQRNPDV